MERPLSRPVGLMLLDKGFQCYGNKVWVFEKKNPPPTPPYGLGEILNFEPLSQVVLLFSKYTFSK